MFIREITKKEHATGKVYVYHRLMEAHRTPKGPRQRIVLDLGRLEIPREQWKTLADRIEQILTGQRSLWPVAESIESLAEELARKIKRKERLSLPASAVAEEDPQLETVDLATLAMEEARCIGGEALGHWAFKSLGFPEMLGNPLTIHTMPPPYTQFIHHITKWPNPNHPVCFWE